MSQFKHGESTVQAGVVQVRVSALGCITGWIRVKFVFFYIFNELEDWILVAGHGCFLVMLGERISLAFVGKSGGVVNLKASYVSKC